MPIDIEAIGVSGEVMIDHEQHDGKYTGKQLQFGINISQAQWPFNKTTIVTIVPRYLVVNKLKRTIQVR
jgi:ribosomal protein L28